MNVFLFSGVSESNVCSPLKPLYMAFGSFSPRFHASVIILNSSVLRAPNSAFFLSLTMLSRRILSLSSDIL